MLKQRLGELALWSIELAAIAVFGLITRVVQLVAWRKAFELGCTAFIGFEAAFIFDIVSRQLRF